MMSAAAIRKPLAYGAAVAVALTAAIGLLHTRSARPLLRALGVHCPVDDVPAAEADRLHRMGLEGLRGSANAPARPAVQDLALDRTTEGDARAWAAAKHIACDDVTRGYRYLRCRGVDAIKLGMSGPPISEMWLSFGLSGKLIGVDLYRRGLNAADTNLAWSDAAGRLQSHLGKPAVSFGDPSPAVLLSSAIQTARIQYRYADYIATVTASNLPQTGLAVREQYMSAKL